MERQFPNAAARRSADLLHSASIAAARLPEDVGLFAARVASCEWGEALDGQTARDLADDLIRLACKLDAAEELGMLAHKIAAAS
jgi:hypothetical protein